MFKIHHRRRRERKTDYKKRLALIKSGEIRVVIRRRLKNISVQFINFDQNGDKTIAFASSQELKKFGWKFNTGNIPAAYLTGLLAGKKAKVKRAILDIGLQTSSKGSRIYAALKGVIDSGIIVNHSNEILPTDNRIKGLHISEHVMQNFNLVEQQIGALNGKKKEKKSS
jgi:large subunit ribosomal protein L18